jgi:hypothetical protein
MNKLPKTKKLKKFPLNAFNEQMKNFIKKGAISINCPEDYIAAYVLACGSIVIGNSYAIKPKNGWTEKPNLFLSVIGDPGAKKSPAMNYAIKPLTKIQEMYVEDFLIERNEIINKKKKGEDVSDIPKPLLKQIRTTDTTVEALVELFLNNLHGVIITLDELAALINSCNQYKGGKGNDLEHFLNAWSSEMIVKNRKNESNPTIVNNPFLSICGSIQPEVVTTQNKGKDNGFVDRFLFSFPESIPAKHTDEEVPTELLMYYSDLMVNLFIKYSEISEQNKKHPIDLELSNDAKKVLKKWHEKH